MRCSGEGDAKAMARVTKAVGLAGLTVLCAVCSIVLVGNGAYLMTADFGGGLAAWGESAGAVQSRGTLLVVSGVLGPVTLAAWVLDRLYGRGRFGRLESALRWCLAGILIWDVLLALMTTA